jgi:hypothetical protein
VSVASGISAGHRQAVQIALQLRSRSAAVVGAEITVLHHPAIVRAFDAAIS